MAVDSTSAVPVLLLQKCSAKNRCALTLEVNCYVMIDYGYVMHSVCVPSPVLLPKSVFLFVFFEWSLCPIGYYSDQSCFVGKSVVCLGESV